MDDKRICPKCGESDIQVLMGGCNYGRSHMSYRCKSCGHRWGA